ncbi:bifunctional metallophosphatase/5'-nucleotidase [Anaerolentibacter hominis]|uniref:bifunctional metallophosphatase/5'-nucleotidase n=1 Tax=Anaerolentibacter hominis TaxID=3079009 RepID=UPI0031B800E8
MGKRWNKRYIMAFLLLLLFAVGITASGKEAGREAHVIFSHDLHSHLDTTLKTTHGAPDEVGGFAKLKTVMDDIRAEYPDSITVDGGDFSMGTLYQAVFQQEALELRMLGQLGYDATTFGNHEFDFTSSGAAAMLKAARGSGDALPELMFSAVDWAASDPARAEELKGAFDEYGVKDTIIIERNGVKIGIFSSFGDDAEACAPNSQVVFRDHLETSKEAVEKLKEEADLIVCLSHGGTWPKASESEDEIMAKEIPDIDLIISGHTHSTLEEPIRQGNTWIVSSGEYGMRLGSLHLTEQEDGSWLLSDYKLTPIDSSVKADESILTILKEYKELVEKEYLQQFGYTFDQVLAYNPYEFSSLSAISDEHTEHTLGNIISDSYIHAVKEAEGEDYEPIDLALVPSGVIRETFYPGNVTVADAFLVSSLGSGADGTCGYPLVSVYLTGREIRTAAEVDASISDLMTTARLYMSGVSFTFNPHRLILNKVTDIKLVREDGSAAELEDDKLYRVVSGLYSAQMLGVVESKSFGILSLVPKDKEGNPVTDFSACIIHDKKGNEVKEWLALAGYLDSFEEEDGVSVIPEYYSATQNRKVVDQSRNIIDLIKNPNKIAVILVLIVVLIIALVILIVVLIVRSVKRRKARRLAGNKDRH